MNNDIFQKINLAITRIGGISSNWTSAKGHNTSEITIMFILNAKEIVTQKDICQMTAMPKQTVNTIITDWHTKGYVDLEAHPKDRRAKFIKLTKEGEQYVNQSLQPVYDMQSMVTEAMDEEKLLELSQMLDVYYNLLCDAMRRSIDEDK